MAAKTTTTTTAKKTTAKKGTAVKATTKATPKAKTATKAAPKATTKAPDKARTTTQKRVVTLRDTKQQSWAQIGEAIGVAPRTVRRLYDEVKGEGAHHGLLEGKGGRTVQA
jgi:DNA-directed RNA polymerase specialized sigma24 family protein